VTADRITGSRVLRGLPALVALLAIAVGAKRSAPDDIAIPFVAITPPHSFASGRFEGTVRILETSVHVAVYRSRVSMQLAEPSAWRELRLRALIVRKSESKLVVRDSSTWIPLRTLLTAVFPDTNARPLRRRLLFSIPRRGSQALSRHWIALEFETAASVGRLAWYAHSDTTLFTRIR
jgi:hypothetical protein